jgi:hypothetical protein
MAAVARPGDGAGACFDARSRPVARAIANGDEVVVSQVAQRAKPTAD